MKRKILAAMSGGVDSSVAAALLVEQGHEVVGVTMRLYDGGGGAASLKSCCGFGPVLDAQRVCEKLGIPHRVLDVRDLFRRQVIEPFALEYQRGRTPNPCIRCNAFLKFSFLLQKAEALGLEAVATGHYARIEEGRLLKGPDQNKDQSYFLHDLHPGNIPHILFPVGHLDKTETRRLARQFDLPVHDKRESQDICFIPNGEYRTFLERHGITAAKGFMFNTAGQVVGEHEGLYRYTVGQRKGLGALGEPFYVVAIETERNALVVGKREDLFCRGVTVRQFSFCRVPPKVGDEFVVRLRYRGPLTPCRIAALDDEVMVLDFLERAERSSPGQSAVLYREEEVVGGGRIETVF